MSSLQSSSIDPIEVRCLRSNAELEVWAELCRQAFSSKANPPTSQYFKDHFCNDPWADLSLVFVAEQGGRFVSSVRLFHREIYQADSAGTSTLAVVGVGEVCTLETHRRLGLSKILLQKALAVARERGYNFALLHAAPWIRHLYEHFGFASTNIQLVTFQIDLQQLFIAINDSKQTGTQVRSISIANEATDITALFSSYRKHSGTVIRNKEYVISWLDAESRKGISVGSFSINDGTEELVGYLVLRFYGDTCKVMDACFAEGSEHLFWECLVTGIQEYGKIFKASLSFEKSVSIVIPGLAIRDFAVISRDKLAPYINNSSCEFSYQNSIEDGWMVATMDSQAGLSSMKFDLFWPIDSF